MNEDHKFVSLKDFRIMGQQLMASMNKVIFITINLKNFKYFNQTYGFSAGDEILEHMKEHFCLQSKFCKLATFTYIDHLAGLIEEDDIDADDKLEYIKNTGMRFVDEINEKYPLAKVHLNCGVYFVEDKTEDIEDIHDKARYARKSINDTYNNFIAVYTDEIGKRAVEEAGVIPLFEYALENNTIELYLQPKFTIDTQKLVGAEALSRIVDMNGNIVPPGVYIPVLEKSGLISELDKRMIELLIQRMKKWKKKGKKLMTVSINLSRVDFNVPGFIEDIDKKIEEADLPKSAFEFELTETVFCENLKEIIEKINDMRAKGYKISMDDFGSGFNSLYVLGMVPIDIIKFDRGFVLNSLTNKKGFAIMSSLVNTFNSTDFDIICEGVETREEEQLVKETGCNVIQGYLHDKPLPIREFENKYL
ncbi:EAL domain-containing protein [Lachnospiraceae bacterium HCP1S3_C3]|nr:EAL domain-containing protein [Lachnospiraceae bacterium]